MIGLPSEQTVTFRESPRWEGRRSRWPAVPSKESHGDGLGLEPRPKPHTPFQWCSRTRWKRSSASSRSQARCPAARVHSKDPRPPGEPPRASSPGGLPYGIHRARLAERRLFRRLGRTSRWNSAESLDDGRKRGFAEHLSRDSLSTQAPRHIDVGLEPDFLAKEAGARSRAARPCGKPVHAKVHHTNLEDARADARKLVCYHRGVACDPRRCEERLVFLENERRRRPRRRSLTSASGPTSASPEDSPHDFAGRACPVSTRYKMGPRVPEATSTSSR
jgi:hypothetical protein